MRFTPQDLSDLKRASDLLRKESLPVRLANIFGAVAGALIARLPAGFQSRLEETGVVLIEKTWEFSAATMTEGAEPPETDRRHNVYAILSGAVGGAGIISLIAELPVTTVIMMRAVADTARCEGEDFRAFDTKLACLQAFALGGDADDPTWGGAGYYGIRALFRRPLDESVPYIAAKGAAGMGAPFAVQMGAKIGARYQTFVTARTAASAVPVAGAIMGGAVNIIFIDYFREKARGHFIMRRLERTYGEDAVKTGYERFAAEAAREDVSKQRTDAIIRHHMYAAMGVGMVPVPLADLIGVAGIQLMLLYKLARTHRVPFSRHRAKQLLAALAGGIFPASLGASVGGSLAKFVPLIGPGLGAASVPAAAGASTYAVGKVFNRHFAEGGTFLNFDPEKARAFYRKSFAEKAEDHAGK